MFDLTKETSMAIYTVRELSRLMYDAILRKQEVAVEIKINTPDGKWDGSFDIRVSCPPSATQS